MQNEKRGGSMEKEIAKLTNKYPELTVCVDDIKQAAEVLMNCYQRKGKLLLCGNGGSAADCEHIVGELMKGFKLQRPIDHHLREKLLEDYSNDGVYLADHLQQALPAISLVSQSGLLTAFSNDVAADMVFAQQVYGYGQQDDVVWGLSTSGNSKNVVKAMKIAKIMDLKTIGLTGKEGGQLKSLCDVTIQVPSTETLDIQERHLPIYHTLCIILEKEFFQI